LWPDNQNARPPHRDVGKRDTATTHEFIADLRERVLGSPEISSDGFLPYKPAIRTEFKNSAHSVINKTYSVTHLAVNEASHRYSPADGGIVMPSDAAAPYFTTTVVPTDTRL
jgi:hypothetical protein